MRFQRLLSQPGKPVYEQVEWKRVDARIEGAKFEMLGIEAPADWSENATNILAQKYLRKAGVPDRTWHPLPRSDVDEINMPIWLRPSVPGDEETRRYNESSETSAHQVFHRMAGCWTYWGWRVGLFQQRDGEVDYRAHHEVTDAAEQAQIFYDETYLCLARQLAVPNSPQWFNTGLHWAYGIEGPDSGQWFIDDVAMRSQTATTADAKRIHNAYQRPQPHACFLTPTEDNLVGPNGIMDTWMREARIFKFGSGSGINASRWRAKGEKLSSGGVASGVMSWLRIGDSSAGAIQSGGTTRRAAKMVCLDADHPEIEAFIDWKVREEAKAASMYVGSKVIARGELWDKNAEIPQAVLDREAVGVEPEVFGIGWEEEAISSVDGQNSNNSVRVTDEFLRRAQEDKNWNLTARTDGSVMKTVRAGALLDRICRAAWASADPGLLFHDTINSWNTCTTDGEIRTTNPCAEYQFLDDTACNLASMRLTKFLGDDSTIDVYLMEHVTRLWTAVLDISISMASFPAAGYAVGTHNYRTLGLGYADLGGLLMSLALPYDSDEGRALAAALTALMTGAAYRASAELAKELGAFPQWEANETSFRHVLRRHRAEVSKVKSVGASGPVVVAARQHWEAVCGAKSFRNAQVTLIAPTGTISFVMDCATTGVEPEQALVKYKHLAGGGQMKIANPLVPKALEQLGYPPEYVATIVRHVADAGTVEGSDIASEDLAVFDCCVPLRGGGRFLRPEAHVLMVAAVQPFLSGAVSKTTNMPHSTTVDDVRRIYLLAHKLGLKAIAIYRDGSKLTQPLNVDRKEMKTTGTGSVGQIAEAAETGDRVGWVLARSSGVERAAHNGDVAGSSPAAPTKRSTHEYLPWRRERGYTQKAKIDGQTLFWRVSEYPDGRPGEIFIELAHEGSTLRATANCVAIGISVALQHGTPLEALVDKYLNTKFEPAGYVEGHDRIRFATSFADLIARDLAITYLGREELANVVRSATTTEMAASVVALDRRAVETAQGAVMTGDHCRECGGLLRQTGTCKTCQDCGWNEGCG